MVDFDTNLVDGFDAGTGFDANAGFDVNASAGMGGTTTAPAMYKGYPLSEINGMQNAQFESPEAAREALDGMDPADLQRRKQNSDAFKWLQTVVDKDVWVPSKKDPNKMQLKSPKFLGWVVETFDSDGAPVKMTDAELLAYVAGNCHPCGRLGSGNTGLALKESTRENNNSKNPQYRATTVISLVPVVKGLTKYSPDKVVAAKEKVFNPDGTPKTRIRPGVKQEDATADDYIQEWAFKPDFAEKFNTRKARSQRKAEEDSKGAFIALIMREGTKPQW